QKGIVMLVRQVGVALVAVFAALGSLAQAADPSSQDSAAISRPVIYFGRYVNWNGLPVDDHSDGSLLAREIVRQALMIAARDELGTLTRDAFIGEQMRTGDEQVFDVHAVTGAKNPRLQVVLGKGKKLKILLEIPTEYHTPLD